MKRKSRFYTYAVLLILFFVSVLVRLPNLNRPLSRHHESNVAMVLICADTWMGKGGPSYSYYSPVQNYTNPGDLFIRYSDDAMTDRKGNRMYTSFGSGWFLVPYYFLKISGLPVAPPSIHLFSLLLELIVVLLVFRISVLVFEEEETVHPFRSYVTVFLFLFSPGLLWYFGNGYVHEIAVLPFFFGNVLLFYGFLTGRFAMNVWNLLLYAFLVFAGILCDWLPVTWIVVTIPLALAEMRKNAAWKYFILVSVFSVMAGAGLILYQYSSYLGLAEVIAYFKGRYQMRGFSNARTSSMGNYLFHLFKNYATVYLPLLIVAGISFFFLFLKKTEERLSSKAKYLLIVLVLTSLLHHLLFIQFSAVHEYAVLKSALWLVLGTAALLPSQWNLRQTVTVGVLFLLVNIGQYFLINLPGNKGFDGVSYQTNKEAGSFIKQQALPQEYVFVNDPRSLPQLSYYSKRSVIYAASAKEAAAFLKTNTGGLQGIWFDTMNPGSRGLQRFVVTRP